MRVSNIFRGLAAKLVLLHLLWIVPALALADYWVLQRETASLERAVQAGALDQANERIAADLLVDWPNQRAMELSLDRHRLLLERARSGFAPGTGHVLLELTETPLSLRLLGANGSLIASSGPPLSAENDRRLQAVSALNFQSEQGAALMLELRLDVPRPSFTLLSSGSFEWRVLLGAAVLLALAGSALLSLYLVRRLNSIGKAVAAWRRGDLEQRINARHHDELGRLATELDLMAADLAQLLDDRARLAALQERQRVARDLHDTAKQKAFALGLQLAALRRGLGEAPTPVALEEAERLSAELRAELADLVHTFRNDPAPQPPFRSRLDARLRRWQMSTGLRLKVRLDPGPEPTPADAEQLLRALDESLANVARHAGVEHAQVHLLDRGRGDWLLEISDNGAGFDPQTQAGTGLAHLAERAACLSQGRLQVQSAPGKGAVVRLHFALSDADQLPATATSAPNPAAAKA